MADVLVAGAGPAGWAAAGACARLGLDTVLVAPDPHARWPATYGMWAEDTALLPPGSAWVEAPARVVAVTERRLARRYAVLDNDSVHSGLTHPDVRVEPGRVVATAPVTLDGGRVITAPVMIDATGARPGRWTEQTAFGVVLPGAPDDALVMDWRAPPGFDASTFLYAVPLPGDRVLLEETSLARRPGLAMDELRARLSARGIPTSGAALERVRIPLDLPVPRGRAGVIPFGAAAALVNPATGYSVADAFRLAPRVAGAIAAGLTHGPDAAVRAAHRVLWPAAARTVHLLRRRGLAVILGLPPHRVARFFESFFALPVELQRRYLGGREDIRGTAKAMTEIFRTVDWPMRTTIMRNMILG